jgi:hypothetical protein
MEYMALVNDPNLQPLWKRGFSTEADRLFQGIRDIPGTNTCFFVELKTYLKTVKSHMVKKKGLQTSQKEKECVRLVVGGDKLDYFGDVATSTADITTFKILISSTLSIKEASMMMMDIKNYYMGTHFPRCEYMRLLLSRFLEEIVSKYLHRNKKGRVWFEASRLTSQSTITKTLGTTWIWLHKARTIAFSLIVDDCSVKYVGTHHVNHLGDALLQSYELTTDW